ncbi:hypothetical protein [Actinomadura madurae]|uniref:hypothetical protein n=2 Tax=Actinomadura madurae TaxID=1993 RepID=UPI0020D204A1|nr:hypothetical protein [Actinomadura madurae]MCP9947223.1 hypothetical protein [Actinomadura madurae]MCQ0012656.1 hypothetical protein [Actinomadura madurae]
MSEPDEPGYDLVVPFVAVTSRGGLYDDDAYAAGWEMAQLDAHLAHHTPVYFEATIHTGNAEQTDLVAMRHGYTCAIRGSGVEGWSHATLTYTGANDPAAGWFRIRPAHVIAGLIGSVAGWVATRVIPGKSAPQRGADA